MLLPGYALIFLISLKGIAVALIIGIYSYRGHLMSLSVLKTEMMDILETKVLEDTAYCSPLHTGICGVHCPSTLHSTWVGPSNM